MWSFTTPGNKKLQNFASLFDACHIYIMLTAVATLISVTGIFYIPDQMLAIALAWVIPATAYTITYLDNPFTPGEYYSGIPEGVSQEGRVAYILFHIVFSIIATILLHSGDYYKTDLFFTIPIAIVITVVNMIAMKKTLAK